MAGGRRFDRAEDVKPLLADDLLNEPPFGSVETGENGSRTVMLHISKGELARLGFQQWEEYPEGMTVVRRGNVLSAYEGNTLPVAIPMRPFAPMPSSDEEEMARVDRGLAKCAEVLESLERDMRIELPAMKTTATKFSATVEGAEGEKRDVPVRYISGSTCAHCEESSGPQGHFHQPTGDQKICFKTESQAIEREGRLVRVGFCCREGHVCH